MVTKYRRKCITAPMRARLKAILAATTAKWGGLIERNGEADHVHLRISLSPTVQLSTFVNNLKTVSSRLIRKECGRELARWYRKPVFWSRSPSMVGVAQPLSA